MTELSEIRVIVASSAAEIAWRERVVALLTSNQQEIKTMSATVNSLDTAIATLVADNVQLQADVAAAPASIAALLATAIANAVTAGATPAELQSMADLHTALGGDHTALVAALAGTPPVITPVATPTPTPAPTGP